MKSPYNDNNGIPIFEGDKIIGKTNFDEVQAIVLFNANGKYANENYLLDKWLIKIVKTKKDGIWIDGYDYFLFLDYHIDENNNCIYYQKINEFI